MSNHKEVRLSLDHDRDQDSDLVVAEERPKLKEPAKYQVLIMNDDFTPMDFVVEVLETFFYMGREKATQIMLAVHTQGKAVCGVYSKDVAETKMSQINEFSRVNDHPLLSQVEAVD